MYGYVGGNPIGNNDKLGLCPFCVGGGAAGGGAAGAAGSGAAGAAVGGSSGFGGNGRNKPWLTDSDKRHVQDYVNSILCGKAGINCNKNGDGDWPLDTPDPSKDKKDTKPSTESCPTKPQDNWDTNKPPGDGHDGDSCDKIHEALLRGCSRMPNGLKTACKAFAFTVWLKCKSRDLFGGN